MAYTKGTMLFKGDYGNDPNQIAQMNIANPSDQGALNTLHDYIISDLTDCTKVKNTFTSTNTDVGLAPGVGANIDKKAVLVCQDTDAGSVLRHEVPAPKPSIIVVTADGERVDQVHVAAFAAQLSLATGKNIIGKYGYIKQKK